MPDAARITVELLDRADLSLKSTLDEAWGKQWQEVLNDTGNGKLVLQNDDPDLALVGYGDFIRFSIDGAVCFAIIVEAKERTDIAPGEDADEFTVISGRGAVAVLEDAVIYPDVLLEGVPFADARVFNFASFTAQGPDHYFAPYDFGDRAAAGPVFSGKPVDFPPVFSHWVGPEAPDGGGDNQVGDWYFFADIFGLPAARYRLFFGYDDRIDIWFDDVPVFASEETTIDLVKSVDLYLDSNIHYLAVRVYNNVYGGVNPSGFTAALCTLNPDETVNTEYWATDPSDPSQLVMIYPATPPGYTPGGLMRKLILEATGLRAVASLGLVTVTFDVLVDSAGETWPEWISPSVNIGTDMLTFLKAIAESSCDFWFDPATWELNLYVARGAWTGVTYIEASNLTDLKHSGAF